LLTWLVNHSSQGRRIAAWTQAERAYDVPGGFPWSVVEELS